MDQPDSAPLPAAPETGGGAMRLVGTTLGGRYKVLSLLGEGGMGAVYLVEHVLMRKRMALKVLNAELSKNREMVARFEREAMAAAHLEHPNVVAALLKYKKKKYKMSNVGFIFRQERVLC